MQKNSVFIGRPLKKEGFHIKNGAIPHFSRIENIIMNQTIPTENKSFEADTEIQQLYMCSNKYQSKLKSVVYRYIVKRNKFKDAIKEVQKKYIIELINVQGIEF